MRPHALPGRFHGLHFFGGHRGGASGLHVAAGFVEKIFAAIICIAFATLASMVAGDLFAKHYGRNNARAVELLTFFGVLIVLGLAGARFL